MNTRMKPAINFHCNARFIVKIRPESPNPRWRIRLRKIHRVSGFPQRNVLASIANQSRAARLVLRRREDARPIDAKQIAGPEQAPRATKRDSPLLLVPLRSDRRGELRAVFFLTRFDSSKC